MGMLDDLLAQAGGNVNIAELAGKFGLDPNLAQGALGQLLPQIADPGVDNSAAVANVAGRTGLDAGALGAMLPMLLQAVQGAGGQAGGGVLDRDGDGNPLNDIMGMFGKK